VSVVCGASGWGKSTELLRLKADLEKKGCLVVYFAADEDDIDPEDVQYTDILLACTRHLLKELSFADPKPLFGWIGSLGDDLKDLAQTEISFTDLKIEAPIQLFAKLTATIRAIPTERKKIRDKVNPHTIALLTALNEFIADAKRKLPAGKTHLVAIADNLDRIVPIPQEHGRTNHDEIFVDRAQQLQGLDCHVIYTIPISMVYSSRATDLRDIYGDLRVLPMIMVQTPDGQTNAAGVDKIIEIIRRRIQPFEPKAVLESEIFSSAEGLQKLCLFSGGHVRNLMLLVRSAINYVDALPIADEAIQRAITQARKTFRRTVEHDEWVLLAKVADSKQIDNADEYRKLLFNRCVLQYEYFDKEGELQPWYDVHPLIRGIQQFKDKFIAVNESQSISAIEKSSKGEYQVMGNEGAVNISIHSQGAKHPLFTKDPKLLEVMDEAERKYFELIDKEDYIEASNLGIGSISRGKRKKEGKQGRRNTVK